MSKVPSLQPEDYEAIRQLVARYNFAIDFGEFAQWAACFTPDGVFECIGLSDGAVTGGRHEGTQALHRYAQGHFRVSKGRARHWNWNLLIEGGGDQAKMTCYLNAQSAGRGGSALLRVTGIYRDELRRTAGQWLFKKREVTIDPA